MGISEGTVECKLSSSANTTPFGQNAGRQTSSSDTTAFGQNAGRQTSSSDTTAFGQNAGRLIVWPGSNEIRQFALARASSDPELVYVGKEDIASPMAQENYSLTLTPVPPAAAADAATPPVGSGMHISSAPAALDGSTQPIDAAAAGGDRSLRRQLMNAMLPLAGSAVVLPH
jgi:hypothetical protein